MTKRILILMVIFISTFGFAQGKGAGCNNWRQTVSGAGGQQATTINCYYFAGAGVTIVQWRGNGLGTQGCGHGITNERIVPATGEDSFWWQGGGNCGQQWYNFTYGQNQLAQQTGMYVIQTGQPIDDVVDEPMTYGVIDYFENNYSAWMHGCTRFCGL